MAYSPEHRPGPDAASLLPDGSVPVTDNAPPLPDELARTLAGLGPAGTAPATRGDRVSRLRPAGLGLAAAALVLALVFLGQNTDGVDITFLWADTRVPFALALVAAGLAGAVIARSVSLLRMTTRRRRR
ncbi:hypothetical protein [Actinoplanes sp. NPDC051859]|uniref:hypothetical protein n=1 Tax=Actinoplanes sp. NPDC051859 TaxID=3363909 RepID=UPI0037B6A9F0